MASGDQEEGSIGGNRRRKVEVPAGVLLGVGNPVLDITADVDPAFLEKHGIELGHATLAELRHKTMFDEVVENYEPRYGAGGSAQHVVRVVQWILGAPASAAFIGQIGTDEYGEKLKRCAASEGMFTHYHEVDDEGTGLCAALVLDNEDISLVASLGASCSLPTSALSDTRPQEMIQTAKFVYCSGYFLPGASETVEFLGKTAVDADKIFLLNLSAAFIVLHFHDVLTRLIPSCDFIFGNEDEAAAFGEAKGWEGGVEEIALRIAGLPKASGTRPRVAVFTQGAGSTIVACQGHITKYPVERVPNELLVDINGAGDAFIGGFVSRLILGETLAECVRAGHWCSRVNIQTVGTMLPRTCDFV